VDGSSAIEMCSTKLNDDIDKGKAVETNWVQVFLYIRESCQQLRGLSLLVIRMPYIILRGCWLHIIFWNVHAPTEDKIDDVKGGFYEELKRIFNKFPKYHMKMLGNFNAKVGREELFKPKIGNESLHEISDGNGVRTVNFATSKDLIVKSTMFPLHNIHKYTWTSPDGKTRSQILMWTTIWWLQRLGRE
jgi:hypothetical protein